MSNVVYNYHPVTGEFLNQGVADESPLEPGVLLIPANATLSPPPQEGVHQVAVFAAGAWSLVADYRGQLYWLDGVERQIFELGVRPPDGSTPQKPAVALPTLAATKDALMDSVDNYISAIYSRFTRFETEYVQREAAARAFKSVGYAGDAGVWVMAFATSAGMSPTQATDLIIRQADTLRAALQQLGALRMRKHVIAGAIIAEDARAEHDEITSHAAAIVAAL